MLSRGVAGRLAPIDPVMYDGSAEMLIALSPTGYRHLLRLLDSDCCLIERIDPSRQCDDDRLIAAFLSRSALPRSFLGA